MRYLLDTHAFIWMTENPEKLSDTVVRLTSANSGHR